MKSLLLNIIMLLLIPLVFLFVKNEFIAAAVFIALLFASFKLEYHKNEWMLFVIGVIAGFIIEFGGDSIYQLQYWSEGSLLGIPLWLPVIWGYGFIFIRRIGNLVVSHRKVL